MAKLSDGACAGLAGKFFKIGKSGRWTHRKYDKEGNHCSFAETSYGLAHAVHLATLSVTFTPTRYGICESGISSRALRSVHASPCDASQLDAKRKACVSADLGSLVFPTMWRSVFRICYIGACSCLISTGSDSANIRCEVNLCSCHCDKTDEQQEDNQNALLCSRHLSSWSA